MRKILKILTFTIVTLTAFVLIFKPELVGTMIPGIVEKIYVTINKIIPIEREDDLKLSIIALAIIMPIFAGIMRFISDFDAKGIKVVLMPFVLIVVCFVTGPVGILFGGFIIYMLFSAPSLFVVISYIYCCFLIFSDSVESRYSSSSSGYSSSGSGAYTGQSAYCDPDEYIARNGFSYICGVVSDKDIDKINNDPLLTDEQKEAIKRELDSKASLYY